MADWGVLEMKASEYITVLQALVAEHGDIEVRMQDFRCSAKIAMAPKVSFLRIPKGRESITRIWHEWDKSSCDENNKGEKVITL
jgi:hypothetical protein